MSKTTIKLSSQAEVDWSALLNTPFFRAFVDQVTEQDGATEVSLKSEESDAARKVLSIVEKVTRLPVVLSSADSEFKDGLKNIEYTCPGGLTEIFGGLTDQRVDALVNALIGTLHEEIPQQTEIEEKVRAVFKELGFSLLYLDLNHSSAYIVLDEPLARMVESEGAKLEEVLHDILPNHFVQIVLAESESQRPSQSNAEEVYSGREAGKYGTSELEVFRSQIERLAAPILDQFRITEENSSIIITTRSGPRLDWFKEYLHRNLEQFPLSIRVEEEGEESSGSKHDVKKLMKFALGHGYNLIKKDSSSYYVISNNGIEYSLNEISSRYSSLFGRKISLEARQIVNEEGRELKRYSPWAQNIIRKSINVDGQIVRPIEVSDERVDLTLPIEPHHVSTSWNLPPRDTRVLAIALDPETSVSDVAFGVFREGNEIWLKAWVANLARLIPIGSEIDYEVRLKMGTLYRREDERAYTLYPPNFAHRYLSLSTKYQRPMIEFSICITGDDASLIDVKEVQGVIDHVLTPEELAGSKGALRAQSELLETLSNQLRERGEKLGRVQLRYGYDPKVTETHLLLYELIGEWMSWRPNIAVPYRSCTDPLSNMSPELRKLISSLCPPEIAKKLKDPSTRKEALLYASRNASEEDKKRLHSELSYFITNELDVFDLNFLTGVQHYVRAGTGLRYDLSRVVQHQVCAAINKLPILSRSHVRERMLEANEFDRSRPRRYEERRRIAELSENSMLIGTNIDGNVVRRDTNSNLITINDRLNRDLVRIYSPRLVQLYEVGDSLSVRIKGYSLAHSAHLVDV